MPISPPWPGVHSEWIIEASEGASHGSALRATVAPGERYEIHRHAEVERVFYLLSGAGTHRGGGGPAALTADDVLVLPAGSWHGFENTGEVPAQVLLIYTPVTSFPADDYERADTPEPGGPEPIRHRLHDVPGRPELATADQGFDGLEVNFDGAAGAAAVVLGFARFPPGATHRWHRHTTADEGGVILSGNMFHVFEGGGRQAIADGDMVWMPAGQWHTVETDPDCPMVDTVWFYVGATTVAQSGYELREQAERV